MNLKNYRLTLRRLLVVVLCLGLFSMQSVSASEGGYTASVSPAGSRWATVLSIPKFDAATGELEAVEIYFTGTVNGSAEYESAELDESTATVVVNADVELRRPDGTVIVAVLPSSRTEATLVVGNGALNLDGPLGQSAATIDGTSSKTIRLTDEADLRAFTGDGEMLLPTVSNMRSRVFGPGNLTTKVNASASANLTVRYIYSDISPDQSQRTFAFFPVVHQK